MTTPPSFAQQATPLDVRFTILGIRILQDRHTGRLFWKVRGRRPIHRLWPVFNRS